MVSSVFIFYRRVFVMIVTIATIITRCFPLNCVENNTFDSSPVLFKASNTDIDFFNCINAIATNHKSSACMPPNDRRIGDSKNRRSIDQYKIIMLTCPSS